MRCTLFLGIWAGVRRLSLASLKLLWSSVGGTHRSSAQKKCTLDHSKPDFARVEKRRRGDLPPEIASVARGCDFNCSESVSRIYVAHASAALCASAPMRCNSALAAIGELLGTGKGRVDRKSTRLNSSHMSISY